MSHFQRLLQYETGLGHTSLGGVNKQDNAVHHFQYALHLAAEVRVTRCVDNIYLHAVIHHRRVFCKDSNTSFTLQIIRVHDSLGHVLVLPERASLLEHFVHQSSLAVVYVSNNSYVSQIFSYHNNFLSKSCLFVYLFKIFAVKSPQKLYTYTIYFNITMKKY